MASASEHPAVAARPSDSARGAIAAGAVVLVLFFGGFGTWAVTAPLNGAVVGNAVVKVEGNRKSVQHLDGGTVRAISVREGDHVAAGDVLITLDDTDAVATLRLLSEQQTVLLAVNARLQAERDGLDAVVFPKDLTDRAGDAAAEAAMTGQAREFDGRRRALAGQAAVLQARIGQLREDIVGSRARNVTYASQLASVVGERESLGGLLDKELITRARILQLDRTEAGIRGQISDTDAAIARATLAITEIETQIAQLGRDRAAEVAASLRETEAKLLDLAPRLDSARAALARTVVRAPYSGTVVALDVFSTGGVIQHGQRVLDIVPDDAPLVVEADIAVEDIAQLRPGMTAEVRFTAYKQRVLPLIRGTVTELSADRLTDPRTGAAFYKAAVTVDRAELAAAPEIALYPGMPATVIVTTEQRSAFDYLVGPLAASFDHAFRQR